MTSKALEKYISNYGGIIDPHFKALNMIKDRFSIERVLYPGSWIHLTPSLVFTFVVYVDFFAKMKSMFNDQELIQYVVTHSETKTKPKIKFHIADYREGIPEEKESFDLLISLSGGFVSQYCGSYLKKNGLLFVNNEHYDATKAFVDDDFSPVGVFSSNGKLIQQPKSIQKYFLTNKNELFTSEMVLDNSKKSPSKAKYKLKNKAQFYLFIRS